MNKIMDFAVGYVRKMNVFEISIFKICLTAFGVLIGVNLKKECRKKANIVAGVVFAVTYVYFIVHMIWCALSKCESCE